MAALRRSPKIPLPRNHFATLVATAEPEAHPTPLPPSATATATAVSGSADDLSRLKSAIRSEANPDRIADLFQSATHLRRFHADRGIYALSVQKLARARRPDLIERLLDLPASDPSAPKSEGFLTRIITLYSGAGMLDHAVRTFDRAAAAGQTLTDRSLCALLTTFLKNGHFDRAIEAFDRVPKDLGITPGLVAHNILLQSFCQKGEVAKARSVLDELAQKESVKPDIVSYNTVLGGCLLKGDESGFEEILKEISGKGLDANVVTYNCRIVAFCRKKESFKAEELLDVMVSKEIQLNRASFKIIIEGFCKEGDVVAAMRVFKRMKITKRTDNRDDLVPDADTYNMLIRGLVKKKDIGSALEVCKECLARKLIPPFGLVKELVEGLQENSKVDEAKDIVERMRVTLRGDAVDAWKKLEGELSL